MQPAGDAAVFVTWDDEGANVYQLRRNGEWVGSFLGDSDAVRTGTTGDDWIIRFRAGDAVADMPCDVTNTPATIACSATTNAQGVVLDWAGVAGVDLYHVRQDGDWIAASQTPSFVDVGQFDIAPYDIRYRLRGMVATLVCAP